MHLTKESMAKILEISPSQLQLYEQGKASIDISFVVEVAYVFGVSISYFFEDFIKDELKNNVLYNQKTQNLVTAYYHISNKKVAENIYQLVLSLAD